MNDYTAQKTRYEVTPFILEKESFYKQWYGDPNPSYVNRYYWHGRDSVYAIPVDPGPGTHLGQAQQRAARLFSKRSRAAISEAQALVSGGEIAESVRMVLKARNRVLAALFDFQHRANRRKWKWSWKTTIKEKNRQLSQDWLEYSFGWTPLVNDSVSLANAAARTIVGSMRGWNVRSMAEHTEVDYDEDYTGIVSGPNTFTVSGRKVTKTISKCYYYGSLNTNVTDPGRFTSNFGLTLDNWVPSVWELIPWSFAIDYFTGLGDYISALCFPWAEFRYIGMTRY
jgi:hypothetical protein